MSGVTVSGLADLEAGLQKAGVEMRDLTAVHPRVADLIKAATRPPILSGRLAASVRADVATGQAIVHAGGAGAPYAGVIEFGSSKRGIRAHRYLFEGVTRSEPGVLKLYADEIQTILVRAC